MQFQINEGTQVCQIAVEKKFEVVEELTNKFKAPPIQMSSRLRCVNVDNGQKLSHFSSEFSHLFLILRQSVLTLLEPWLSRLTGRPIGILAVRAQHHPPPSDLIITPSRNDIGPRAKDQVEMLRQDRKAKQVEPKVRREQLQILLNSDLSVVEVLTRTGVVPHEKHLRTVRLQM